MPLTMARAGETDQIKKIGGKEEVRKFLEDRKSTRLNSSHM